MAAQPQAVPLRPVIRSVISEIKDRRRMSEGIEACATRRGDFASEAEMELTGAAMVPEARRMLNDKLTAYWNQGYTGNLSDALANARDREVIIGAGFHAAVYCANRAAMGFPRPIVLESGTGEQVGGAFAMSLEPVFRLNSRNRPGSAGLPDQDKALNYLPGGLLQPSMVTSEEYPTNADMALVIRLALAQFADVVTGTRVTEIQPVTGDAPSPIRVITEDGTDRLFGRVLDARGLGTENGEQGANGVTVITFGQLMQRMGSMFPLRGMKQVAVIGSGDSGKCAVESMLGIAPGNTSAIGLDYVERVDWYTSGRINGRTCSEYRDSQRGRYLRIAQYLEGNVSNPRTRLRVMDALGTPSPLPDSVIVNDRTYDMAMLCTGSKRKDISDTLGYFGVKPRGARPGATFLGTMAAPFASYRLGPCADLGFSDTEFSSGVAEIPANRVAMFRLAPRTAALAAMLPGVGLDENTT